MIVRTSTTTVFGLIAFLSAVCVARRKPTDFCHRGFQIAGRYHECWEQATAANVFEDLYKPHDFYDGKFVEKYATHMCSIVKPQAIECLRREVRDCPNLQKLVDIADDSGGACTRNHLNPFFKLHIIDKLQPIAGESECFSIADKSYQCYAAAGQKIIKSGTKTVDIGRFHIVADKFFDSIWQCLIDMFKASEDTCPNWQIPMLLALQRTAMPSLFGMRLNNYQVAKLELENPGPNSNGTATAPENCTHIGCKTKPRDNSKVYILMRILTQKPEKEDGDIVLEVDSSAANKPEFDVVGNPNAVDVNDFLAELMSGENQMTLQDIREIKKEQRRKNKEIRKYLNQIKESQKRKNQSGKNLKKKTKKTKKTRVIKDLRNRNIVN